MSESPHIPILLNEIIHYLDVQENDIVLDGTVGFGGHAEKLSDLLGGRVYILPVIKILKP